MPSKLILKENEIHIWVLNNQEILSPSFSPYLPYFSQEELRKLELMKSPLKREQFIKNRLALKLILAKYLHISPQEIFFDYTIKGKPFINQNINHSSIYFNLSHKNNYTIYTIALQNIGVDLEKIDKEVKIEKIAKRFFCKEEYEYLKKIKEEDKLESFFRIWTIKEAYFKLTGEGLSGGLNTIYIDIMTNNSFKINEESVKTKMNLYIKTWRLFDDYIMTTIVDAYFPCYDFYHHLFSFPSD